MVQAPAGSSVEATLPSMRAGTPAAHEQPTAAPTDARAPAGAPSVTIPVRIGVSHGTPVLRPLTVAEDEAARSQRSASAAQAPTPAQASGTLVSAARAIAARQSGLGTFFADLDAAQPHLPPGPAQSVAQALQALRIDTTRPVSADALTLIVRAMMQPGIQTSAGPQGFAALAASLSEALRRPTGPSPDGIEPLGRDGTDLHINPKEPPPPFRHATPKGQPAVPPRLDAQTADSQDALAALAKSVEGARARVQLLQLASLPERTDQPASGTRIEGQPTLWSLEVPLLADGRTAILDMRIGPEDPGMQTAAERVWQARFALDLEPLGPVSAHVRLAGNSVTVRLFAERPDARAALTAGREELGASLKQADLDVAAIDIRAEPARQPPPPAGLFTDHLS
jgi:hypothetical protein